MSQKAPGKAYRNGLSLGQITEMFPDNKTAEQWLAETRWPSGPRCPVCDSAEVQYPTAHKTMPYRCQAKGCRKRFSVKTGTIMESSKVSYREWAIAVYLFVTNRKGVSSMKLRRDLGRTQKTAWHLARRLREAWAGEGVAFTGPVEEDEIPLGGKEKHKHLSKKLKTGRGAVGKTAVIGLKDRETNPVTAASAESPDRPPLQGFVLNQTLPDAKVGTDDHGGSHGLPNHEAVTHSVGESVDGMAHTNGIESFWAMLKRVYHGTFRKRNPEHLDRYVRECSGRHNLRSEDMVDQMVAVVRGMTRQRWRYRDLIASAPMQPALNDLFQGIRLSKKGAWHGQGRGN